MEEHTISVVASNLTAAYFSGGAPLGGPEGGASSTPTRETETERLAAVMEKFNEFSAVLREHALQEYEQAQRDEEQAEREDVDKPVHIY